MPIDYRAATFDNHDNRQNIARNKAVGEPPLMLAIAAWAAVKNALSYANAESAAALTLPATGEEILRCLTLCANRDTQAKSAPGLAALVSNAKGVQHQSPGSPSAAHPG